MIKPFCYSYHHLLPIEKETNHYNEKKILFTPQPQYKLDQPLTLINCSLLNAKTPPTK